MTQALPPPMDFSHTHGLLVDLYCPISPNHQPPNDARLPLDGSYTTLRLSYTLWSVKARERETNAAQGKMLS